VSGFSRTPLLPLFVNKSEQFAANLLDGFAKRSIEHLRVHVQRRIDVSVTINCATVGLEWNSNGW
jgi:hypothetical protein